LLFGLSSVATPHQDSCCPDGKAELEVARLVADHDTPAWIEIEVGCGGSNKAWARLTAGATVLWQVGAHVDAVEIHSLGAQYLSETRVNLPEACLIEIPTGQTGLVGHNYQAVAKPLQTAQTLSGAQHQLDLVRVRKIVTFDDNRAVAVKQDNWSAHGGARVAMKAGASA
jgi:hypothetical protein